MPVGSSLVAVGGDQKIVMNATGEFTGDTSELLCCGLVGTGDLVMALSTVDTNQIANGKVKNEDMVASTSTNPFASNDQHRQRPDDPHRQRTLGALVRLPCPRRLRLTEC